MLTVDKDEVPLTAYLVKQVLQSGQTVWINCECSIRTPR
jgi:hypothetical protein